MIELPEDFKLGLTKVENLPKLGLAARSHEDAKRSRVAFLNRKQDRFTFSVRFYYSNENNDGKKWGKWQTLNAFSATLKNGRLNLFLIGSILRNRKYPKVVNITRQPYLLYNAYADSKLEVLAFLQKEFTELYERNGLKSPFSTDEKAFVHELLNACYPAWNNFTGENGPVLAPTKFAIPPLFVTDIMREQSFETALDRLLTPQEVSLRILLKSAPEAHLNPLALWMLALTRKRLEEGQRIELVKASVIQSEYMVPFDSEITADHLAQARSITKPFDKDIIFSIAESSNNKTALQGTLDAWRNHKNLIRESGKTIQFDLAQTPNPKWINLFNSVQNLKREIFNKDQEVHKAEVKNKVDLLISSGYFQKRSYNETVHTNIHDRYDSGSSLPYRAEKKDQSETFTINFPEETMRKSYYFEVLTHLGLHVRKENETTVVLRPVDYALFLDELRSRSIAALTKAKISPTEDMIALHLAAIHIFNNSPRMRRFKGHVPPKWFTLTRKGLSPYGALYFTEKRTANKSAVGFAGIPDTWIERAFEEPETNNPYSF